MKKFVAMFFVLLISTLAFAQFNQNTKSDKIILNPKQVDYLKVRIIQSGTLRINGFIRDTNIILHMPQDGVESVSVITDGTWETIQDEAGNKQLKLEWKTPVDGAAYRIETVVSNTAKTLPQEKQLGNDEEYLKESKQIVFTDEMRRIAYP